MLKFTKLPLYNTYPYKYILFNLIIKFVNPEKIFKNISTIYICVLVYVDMGLSTNSPVVLTVVTAGNSFARSFSIKVSQIECNSLAKGI